MTVQENDMERLFGSILSRYGIPLYGLPLSGDEQHLQATGVGDRGDLESDLAEAVRKLPQQQMPVTGEITAWKLGDVRPWGEISVQFGPFSATVNVTSRQARQLAIEVLAEQGPYLAYQPPNPQMREHSENSPMMMGYSKRSDELPEWERRASVRDLSEQLQCLRAKHGGDTFGWALQMTLDQPVARDV